MTEDKKKPLRGAADWIVDVAIPMAVGWLLGLAAVVVIALLVKGRG